MISIDRRLQMPKLIAAILAVFGMSLAPAASAAMSDSEYRAALERADRDYEVADEKCEALQGHAEDVCEAQAKAALLRAKADARYAHQPTAKDRYDQRVAHAKADYIVAKERCEEKAGNDRDVCKKAVRADYVKAKAEAEADYKSAKAGNEASTEATEARKDAAKEKVDAEYKLAIEKCDSLSGDAKAACVDRAKAKFGKS
jgi:hypothetical protein